MQIGGQTAFQSLRQPTAMGSGSRMEGQKLIFLYPILIDNALFKYASTIRDFFAVQYVSKIKEQNALNISIDSIKNVGQIGHGSNAINPAQFIRQSLWSSKDSAPVQAVGQDSWTSQEYRMMYQEKLNQFHEFIKNQIKYDPRYKGFQPVISSITISNLLQLSLIVGTKQFSIDSVYIYWVLITAVAYNIPLDTQANLNKIFNIIENIPSHNYISLISDKKAQERMFKLIGVTDITNPKDSGQSISDRVRNDFRNNRYPTTSWKKSGKPLYPKSDSNSNLLSPLLSKIKHAKFRIIRSLNDVQKRKFSSFVTGEKFKAKLFFNIVLDPAKWNGECNNLISNNSLTIDQISIPGGAIQTKHYDRAMTSFTSYIENAILPIFYSLDMLTGPQRAGVDVPMKINSFVDAIISDSSQDFLEISNMIVQDLRLLTSMNDNSGINHIVDLCKQGSDISTTVHSNLDQLNNHVHLNPNFNGETLSAFAKSVKMVASQLNSKSKFFDEWIKNLAQVSNTQLVNKMNGIDQKFINIVDEILFKQFPTGLGSAIWIDSSNSDTDDNLVDRFKNFKVNICEAAKGDTTSTQCIREFYKQIYEIRTSIIQLMNFFFRWNFFSYTCDYINDVSIDVDIQRKDALEFPNYCLVLPIELVKGLYSIIITNNFKRVMSSSDVSVMNERDSDIIMDVGNIARVIKLVNQRLKVPNLIIIDEAKQECWVQFMFDVKPVKVNFSTMKNYISHQQDILQVF